MLRNKHTIFSCILVLGLVSFFSGCKDDLSVNEQTQSEIDLKPSGTPPQAVVVDGIYDFGSMEVDQTLSHEFVIKNEGEGVLQLKKGRSTCKCTVVNFEEAELAPGESISILLEWTPKAIDPSFSHAGYLKTNDPVNEEISIAVTGRVDSAFEILPAGTWDLGELEREKTSEFNGTISSRVLDKFEIKEVTSDNPLVTIELIPMNQEQLAEHGAKKGYLIKGVLATGSPLGIFKEQVTLKFDIEGKDGQKESVTRFTVEGFYTGPYQIVGPAGWATGKMTMRFRRFSAKEGKIVKLSMFVRGNTGPAIEITEVISQPDFMNVTLKKDESFKAKNRERYQMTIEVKPNSPAAQFYKENPAIIKVVTNNPLIGTMSIRVQMISY
ncbi:MAG: DUF1573 domain-containing protein [Planctomycetaceae bacterium]|nr:DUF1573 domain-containing protein [Planctomycetaceae bacterium]